MSMITKKHITPEELLGTEKVFEYLKIHGKYYQSDAKDGKLTFVEVSEKKVEAQIKMANELADNLKDSLDAKKILVEIFMAKYDRTNLKKLYKTVFKSKKIFKAKTRSDYCVDMKVGNHIIPIID